MAISTVRSRSQASAASIFSCSSRLLVDQRVHLVVVGDLAELLADLLEAVEQALRLAQRLP